MLCLVRYALFFYAVIFPPLFFVFFSQFFISNVPFNHLDGLHVVLGKALSLLSLYGGCIKPLLRLYLFSINPVFRLYVFASCVWQGITYALFVFLP